MPSKRTLTTPIIPRGKRRIKQDVSMFDFYKKYESHDKYSRAQYTGFISDYYKAIANLILDGFTYKFSRRLGSFRVQKFIPSYVKYPLINGEVNKRGMKINWGATMKAWNDNPAMKEKKILLYHENKHSDNYKYHLYWYKAGMNFTNNKIYGFKPCRNLSLAMGDRILKGQDYLM